MRPVRIECRVCRMVLFERLAHRLADQELWLLREHVRVLHPTADLAQDAGLVAVLRHYDLAPGPMA